MDGAHRLHGWSIVAHDGGQFSPAYSVHNLLREDTSVFSTSEGKREDVTVVLRHEAGPFTLTGVAIQVPLVGFTSPLRHAAIFTSWDLPGPSSVGSGWARVTCESEWHDRVEAHHLQQRQEALQLLHASRCPPTSTQQPPPPPCPLTTATPSRGSVAGRTLSTLCALHLLRRHPHPGSVAQAHWGALLSVLALGEGAHAAHGPAAHAAQQARRRAALHLCGALARIAAISAAAAPGRRDAEAVAQPRTIPPRRSGAGELTSSSEGDAGGSLASSVAAEDAPSSLELSVASSSGRSDPDDGGLSAGVMTQQEAVDTPPCGEVPHRKTCSGAPQAAGGGSVLGQDAASVGSRLDLERMQQRHLEARRGLCMPRLPARWVVTARAAAACARPALRGARPAAAAAAAARGEERVVELALPPTPPAPAAWVELQPDQSHCFVPLETPMSGRYLVVKLLRGRERWGGNNLDVTHLALFGSAGPLAFAPPRCEAMA